LTTRPRLATLGLAVQLVSTDPNRPGIFAFGQVAVGVFAFGQSALGVVAIGQLARGIFCVGQGALGVFCVGQGSVGLWHATGMVALAGQSGYGLALHTLPRRLREAPPVLAEPTPLSAFAAREVTEGWIPARLVAGEGGGPELVFEGGARVDASAIEASLAEGLRRGADRAHVLVRAEVVVDDGRYRSAATHTDLVAATAIVYAKSRPVRIAYGVPPSGAPGEPASVAGIALRSAAWMFAFALVSLVTFAPLARALLD
jgi:hypothetical protein